jgi:hypothetical protein
MAVGFAAGGMTQSLYNDPTKIDSLIDQVMTAAQTNPSLLEQLSKRGISINTTQADMQPTEMKQANTQPVELAHGGLTHSGGAPGTTGATPLGFTGDMGTAPTVPTKAEGGTGFNPFQYGLGFSSFGLTNPAGSVPTPVAPAPVGGFTAPAPVAPARPTTGRNSVAVGESYIHPGTGETKTRMPDAYYAGGGRSDQKRALDLSDVDPKAWRSDFNYKNSDELYAQTMEKLKGDVGFIGKIVGKTSIGRIGNAGNLANLQSNIDYLKQRGGTKEQIAALQKAHDDLTIEQLGSLEGGIITGWAQNQLSTESLLADNSESDMVGGGSSSSNNDAGKKAAEKARIQREQDKINKEIGEAAGYSSTPQTIANQSGRTATDRANEQAQQANAEKKLAKANKAFAKKSGIKDAEDYTVGNKGGLMIKKK